jgi:hypothetical protein
MDKILLNNSTSTDGTVKNSDKVDGLHASDILNAAGGGGGGCYYTTATACMTGYARAPWKYPVGQDTNICCGLDSSNTCSAFQPGSTCQWDTIYAFYLAGSHYMTTPGRCDNYITPFCNGGIDSLQLSYKASPVDASLANSTMDGSQDTTALSTTYAPAPAAQYCYNMIYGWYSDWFLPAINQLQTMVDNRVAIGWFSSAGFYWSSTNANVAWWEAYRLVVWSSVNQTSQNDNGFIRCIRKI